MNAPSMQMIFCIPVLIDEQLAAVQCSDVHKVLSANAITPLPGAQERDLGITSDGQAAWLVCTVASTKNRPRKTNKSRVLCLAGIPSDAMLSIYVDRVQAITSAPLRTGVEREFGPVKYTETVFVEGAEVPLLTSAAILNSVRERHS